MKQAMLKTICDHLEGEVTSETKKAWQFFLSKIMAVMINDNYERHLDPSQIRSNLPAPLRGEGEYPQVIMDYSHTIVDDIDEDDKLGLTPKQASMVHDSWQIIKLQKNLGLKIFGRLFEMQPSSLQMF
mmetsp:Transcript_30395/g.46554  ORF Transcript_30395/g.46554 Transcript_30395/m.46554 type:complete len:128 (+) Transcript_30395:473-856(+)